MSYYRTVIKVEVLSESPLDADMVSLDDISYFITFGNCSGLVTQESAEEVDAPTMARLLLAQGSDPEFFGLNEAGEEVQD